VIAPTSPAKAPMFAIIVHEKGGAERREVFDTSELSVGRVQGNELMLPKGNVSKRHARLLYRDGRFIVTDLNSTNGTYVNRRKITQATIVREGDRIYVGDFVLRIEVSGSGPNSTEGPRAAPVANPRSSPSAAEAMSNVALRASTADADESSNALNLLRIDANASGPLSSEAPPRLDIPQEATGTHDVIRTSQDERADLEPRSVRDVASALVAYVVGRLRDVDWMAPVPPSLGERVDGVLHMAWAEIGPASQLHPGVAPDRAIELARCELIEHGPLTELIADPGVSEIGVTRFDKVVAVRNGRLASETGFSSSVALRWAISRLCAEADAPLLESEREGVVERRILPGVQLSAIMGFASSNGACVSIRKARSIDTTLEDLVRRGAISRAMATFLQQCLAARVNVLIVGPRDGGVESLFAALAQSSSDTTCVFIGEREPSGHAANWLVTGSDAPAIAGALRVAASLPGARVAVELGSGELCAKVVEAIADGCDGVVATRYAPNLRRALARLPGVVAATRPELAIAAARELVAHAFEIVVEIARLRDERHRVLRIAEITTVNDNEIQTQDIFTFVIDRTAAGGTIEGTFAPSGVMPQLVDTLRARGASIESSVFSRPPSR
jgi:Flp pilus assembly CpaF family ATPase/pSer/pThr/pTyr-binding forkhead associated (FHA) protein